MFYSHTFLARKGPLGTVWCAAHLQHKLKKSHYIATDVSKTVKQIMYPDFPIALRLSGHLLLGVVRIYSKQVDYLYEECNEIRITINRVFTTVSVNLPNDATHAPVHSITLPEKFDLDTIELDDYYKDWDKDPHLKSQVDITLTEQIPTGKDPYIIISFDEHDSRDSPLVQDDSGSGPTPMEDDAPPAGTETAAPDFQKPPPSNQLGADGRIIRNSSPQNSSSVEIMRDAQHGSDFNNSPILPDRAEPDTFLEEQINKHKEVGSPATKEIVSPDGNRSLFHNHDEQHSFGHLDSPIPYANQSPQLEIRSSPPVGVHRSPEMELRPSPPVAQPRVRRNRKRLYDESTVLSNRQMKKALNDTSSIRRVKKNCPLSFLAIWRQNNSLLLRKEGLFVQPFVTGCSAALQGIYKEDCAKRYRVSTEETHQQSHVAQPLNTEITEETHQEANVAQPPDVEIEILRNNECASPNGRNCFTPDNSNLDLQSEHLDTTNQNEISPTADMGASGNLDSEVRTPDTFYAKDMQAEGKALSDIPKLVASPGELRFLEQDDNSPAGSQGTPASGMLENQRTPEMSSRTRAVAQYLERQAVTPLLGNSEEPPEELSLNKILEGKSRKICARMFYETLVLKSLGLVEARQEDPYGDITLQVTPKLSKEISPS